MVTKPFPYQEEDVRQIEEFDGRALVAGEMGVGKSLEALLYCYDHPNLRPIIVVCPKSLKWNWVKEAFTHIGMKSIVLEGGKPTAKKISRTAQLYIINYDILGGWLQFLKSLNPLVITGDEIHYIKSRRSKRAKYFKELCKGVPHILALSGTPLVNRPAELWTIINLLRPKVFSSWRQFADDFCEPTLTRWGITYNGATNLDKLNKLLQHNVMIRRLKKDILKDLPLKSRYVVPLPIEKPQEYKSAEKDFIKWLEKQSKKRANKAKRAASLVKMGYMKRLASSLKLKSVFEWIDNFFENSNEKLVLFCIHKIILKSIYDRYQNKSVFIDGSVSGEDRQKAVNLFQKSKWCKLFIGNIAAAGIGITLTSASTVVFAELDWVPGNMMQCEDRIHRIGQESDKVQIFYLVAHGTIEEKLCEILQKKQKVLDATLDGTSDKIPSTLNVYDELELELRRTLNSPVKAPRRP